MKQIKQFSVVFIALIMCLLFAVPVMASNDRGVTYEATFNTPTINVSDEDQTVVVTVKTNQTITLDTFTAKASVSDGLSLSGIANSTLNTVGVNSFTSAHYYLQTGMISYYTANAENTTTDVLAEVTIKVPANTPAGDYTFTFEIIEITSDWWMPWESDATVTATLTIKEAAPACDHANTKAVPNNNSTHNIVCDGCGETVDSNVKCDFSPLQYRTSTIAGKHSGYVVCEECEYERWAGYLDCEDSASDGDHKCDNCGNDNVSEHTGGEANCQFGARCEDCQTIYTDKNPDVHYGGGTLGYYKDNQDGTHTFICGPCGQPVAGTTGYHDKGSLVTAPNCKYNGYWECSVCNLTYMVEKDPDVHAAPMVSYKDKTDKTHTIYYACCPDTSGIVESHSYDTTTHKCVCGDVEKFTLTITVLAQGGETVELTVPYNANLLEVLAQAAAEEKLLAVGDCFPVNDHYVNGMNIISGYSYKDENAHWFDLDENSTMPAKNFAIDQDYKTDGWRFYGGVTEFYSVAENGYLYGWNYIEEDYDDVEGGAWYYFDEENGYLVTGLTRVPYPTDAINGITYEADQETLDYCEGKGETFIDATEAWFVFGEDGKFQNELTAIQDGKYIENGMIAWNPGLVEVDGELYYFIGDVENGGNTLANGDTYIIRANGIEGFAYGEVYNFVDGQLSGANGIVNGKYYENSKLMMGEGLVKLDEGYIYVRSNGQLATGDYWVTNTNGLVNAGMYNFGTDGILVSTVDPSVNGLVDGKYYKNGMPYYAGLIEIDGETYYVKSNGEVATGTYYVTKVDNYNGDLEIKSGDKLIFDVDGKLETIKNGIVEENGALYYYENNHVQYGAGLVELDDGSIIYVRSNGQLAIGEYWPTTLNDVLLAGKYTFGENGKLITE